MNKTHTVKGNVVASNAKTSKSKADSSSQQNITSFFGNKASSGGLFSTFGSSNKSEKKPLNLSTKKRNVKMKDVQDCINISSNADTTASKSKESDETINLQGKKDQPKKDKEISGRKNSSEEIKSALTPRSESLKNNTLINSDSDDDLIPPTPSPASCQRSVIQRSSLTRQDKCTNKKKSCFTNLKLTQAINKKEKLTKMSNFSLCMESKIQGKNSLSADICEVGSSSNNRGNGNNSVSGNKKSSYSLCIQNKDSLRVSDGVHEVNSCSLPGRKDSSNTSTNADNSKSNYFSRISNNICEVDLNSLQERNEGQNTLSNIENIDQLLLEVTSLTSTPNSARNTRTRIGQNSSNQVKVNEMNKTKTTQDNLAFNHKRLKLQKHSKSPSHLDFKISAVNISNEELVCCDDSSVPKLAPQKIVMKKTKAKSLKRLASKGISPTSKRHHSDIVQHSLKDGDCDFHSNFDDEEETIALLYGAEQSTPTNKPPKPGFPKQNKNVLRKPAPCAELVDGNKTVTDVKKTPIKNYDRQSIHDISLVTPTKNSPNASRDSLMGVELDSLMDGMEWSPMPKKTMARSKLFEEYSPHNTPYSRFLVLEVYRREANNEEALSKYGRVISEKVLRLFDESQSVERYCYLRQDWEMTEVEPGDVVHVTGEFDMTSGVCILDNQTDQYIVVHPDTLVSGTTVAGATRCLRRSILNERFRTEDTNEAMLMGTFLHELFDNAMKSKEFSTEYLNSQAKSLLQQHSYLNSLYSLGMTELTAMDKITAFIPELSKWAKRFVISSPDPDLGVMDYKTASGPESSEQPSVCIAELKDIEENVWSPRFGLKGKVDATVEVKIDRRPKIRRHRPDKDNTIESCVVPLELKTGKVFSKLGSVDHRAQVILYTLLLSDRHCFPVESGVLYYMKAAHMVGVPALVHEKRALIMRRNEVARYLSLSRSTGGRQMPGMLKDAHTCNRCSQAQNCTLFHKSLESGDDVTSGLGEDFDKLTHHVTSDHSRFFSDWFKLVCLEGKEIQQSGKTSQHHIWSMKGLDREALGHCFSGMVLKSRDFELDSDKMFMHKFERSADIPNKTLFVEIPLSIGDYVVISEVNNSMVAIATGYIRDIKPHEVVVSLDRDLLESYRSPLTSNQAPIYRVDKNNGYNSQTTLWSNIARLLHNDKPRNDELRRLIIDLKAPVFTRSRQALLNFGSQSSSQDSQQSKSSQASSGYRDTLSESHMEGLNVDQKRAIMKVLCAEDYTLILGMPGTGKTTTIACLVRMLVARGKSVLLTSYTHTAVDNILLKLKQADVDFLRLGQVHKLLPEIQPYSTQSAGAHIKTVNELRDFYMSKNVVATTCLGVNHALFSQRSFDYCIVDEASQITLPVCLGPLHHASVFVLVGDHYQLPPLVQSLEAREGGMDISLFKRLSEHHPQAMVCLEHQYRMNKDIMALSNTLIYENRLKCGTQQIADTILDIPRWDALTGWFTSRESGSTVSENWLLKALDPRRPVIFLNTDKVPGYESRREGLVSNETEAVIVQQLTCALDIGGVMLSSVGIISPYRHQLKLIREALGQDPRESRNILEINTVDKYQGRDKPCILVSLVRSNEYSSVGDLLKDWRRVNVAVTRAKSKLILIGSLSTLKASLLLHELLDLMETNEWIYDLPKDAHKMFVDLVLKDSNSQ